MRILLTTIVIILVIIGLAIFLFDPDFVTLDQDVDSVVSTSTDTVDQTEEVTWQRFETTVADFSVSLAHPSNTSISAVNDTMYEIKYIGPNNQPNTEIADGYYISLTFSETNDLEAYAAGENPTSNIQPLTFNGRSAVMYTNRSALGTADTNIVYSLSEDSDWILDITYSIHGRQVENYQTMITNIIETIEISLPESEEQ